MSDVTATCGSCDYRDDGFVHRCYDSAPYRADFRWLGGGGDDYTVPVCARHAAAARTHDSLKRIYSAALAGRPDPQPDQGSTGATT